MKRTPLYETHRALGATFSEVHPGRELAAHFGDPVQEHHMVRKVAGLIDLSHRGRLRLSGSDRAKFLHRIISNDVEKLKPGEGNSALMLTNRGKVIADMKVYAHPDAISLETHPEATEVLYRELDKYLIADDVTIEDISDTTGTVGVHGPQSGDLLKQALGLEVDALAEHHSVFHTFDGQAVLCVRENETGERGYNLTVESAALAGLWEKLSASSQASPVGLTALESLRIEAGIPRFGAELDDTVIPLEAELESAISFEKGCYIGQEIVARMKYRGHPNRLLRGFVLETDTLPQNHDLLFDGEKEVGWVTSTVYAPTLGKTIAMGYIRTALADSGNKVDIQTANERLKAEVVQLPFYQRA